MISEHRLYYLLDIADRFIWLDQGEVRSVYTREEILAFSPAQISAMGLRALDLKQVESEAVHLKHPEHEFTFQKLECKYPVTACCISNPYKSLLERLLR